MAKKTSGHSVFISYAHRDRSQIDGIVKNLKARGFVEESEEIVDPANRVFIPGSSIRGVLREAIQSAGKVVIVWSDESAASQWVNYEMGMAEALGKPIVVVVPKGEARSLPSNLRDVQVVEVQHEG